MPQAQKRKLFSKSERQFIWKHALGKPTGVKVELAGFEFNLTMLTTAQAQQILDIVESIPEFQNAGDGKVQLDQNKIFSLVATRGREVMAIAKSILLRSAEATEMIDGDEGRALFDEWFNALELLPTANALLPGIIQANGLGTLLKNAAARAAAAAAPADSMATAST